ncbi:MAG: DUF3413 domain-containing protein [Bacteroidaceae bacterium]|nr:DUF3413 domain-containing protein [Bacteroidaceae bacterium]
MKTTRNVMEKGFVYYLLSTVAVAIQFFMYLISSSQISFMDIGGWIFFIGACLAHAALFTLIPYLILFMPVALSVRNKSWAFRAMCVGMILLETFCLINGEVFSLYHFHINGIVLNMVFGTGSAQIFDFNIVLYLKVCGMILVIAAINLGLLWLSGKCAARKRRHKLYVPYIILLAALTLFTNAFHTYSFAIGKRSVVKSATFLPFYFPLTANHLMVKLGIVTNKQLNQVNFYHGGATDVNYPKHPIQVLSDKNKPPLNIIILAIDSWNKRTLTPECMPNTYAFAQQCENYTNHLSSSNGTRGGLFGLFYGISSYYWKDFDLASIHPVLIHELLKQGYYVQAYPSATLLNPPFTKNIFREVPNLNVAGNGNNAYERDCDITNRFLSDLQKYDGKRPFFSFIFYDMAHAIAVPKDKLYHFQPSWTFADYTKLNNDMDTTPYFNLYRNCTAEVDSLAGKIYQSLEAKGLLKNTVVIITGDHAQEFNENHKNYWGHGSNYTTAQISTPFLYYYPDCKHQIITHRTTHYDVSATLLHDVLGVTNPISDYSMGLLLHNPSPRNWHIVGSKLDFAFIIDQNRIIEKKGAGYLDIYDAHLNPLKNYKLNAVELNKAIIKLNSFYK